jgi:hypothetical protein
MGRPSVSLTQRPLRFSCHKYLSENLAEVAPTPPNYRVWEPGN